jgi:hypothetical protein
MHRPGPVEERKVGSELRTGLAPGPRSEGSSEDTTRMATGTETPPRGAGLVPEGHLDLVDRPLPTVLTTEMPDGRLQSTVVW